MSQTPEEWAKQQVDLCGYDGAEKVNGTQLMSATDPQKQMFCFQAADCISVLRESKYLEHKT